MVNVSLHYAIPVRELKEEDEFIIPSARFSPHNTKFSFTRNDSDITISFMNEKKQGIDYHFNARKTEAITVLETGNTLVLKIKDKTHKNRTLFLKFSEQSYFKYFESLFSLFTD